MNHVQQPAATFRPRRSRWFCTLASVPPNASDQLPGRLQHHHLSKSRDAGPVNFICWLATAPGQPLGADEVRPSESVILMSMDHRPSEIGWANEKLHIAESAHWNQRATALVGAHAAAKYMHRKPSDARRERHYQVMVARLTLVLIVGLRPMPEARPTSERLAIYLSPGVLGRRVRRLVELIPFDPGLAEVFLQLDIAVSGQDSTRFLWLTTPSSATAECGAAPAWWAERRRRKQVP